MIWRNYNSMSSKNTKYITIYQPNFAKSSKQKKHTGDFYFLLLNFFMVFTFYTINIFIDKKMMLHLKCMTKGN